MMRYFLGVDVGGTKTAALIADETGRALAYGVSGSGNHEGVGWNGFRSAVQTATEQALAKVNLTLADIAGAGLGIAGYDWPSQKLEHVKALSAIGFNMPMEIVNDAALGIPAGTEEGWGLSVVSGTGCNCRGWDRSHQRQGRAVGGAPEWSGEHASGHDILLRAMRAVAYEWTQRGPATQLSQAFIQHVQAKDLGDLIEGVYVGRYEFDQSLLMLVFEIAHAGDTEALNVLRWAGEQLGGMALGVIRQLNFENESFEVVLIGSVYNGHAMIAQSLSDTIRKVAPHARIVRLTAPPVTGGVLLSMRAAGLSAQRTRHTLLDTAERIVIHKGK